MKKRERKFSKLNVYQKQGIEDPVEIEKYKKELMELDEMGYKSMKKI